jgi:hypothetical protein
LALQGRGKEFKTNSKKNPEQGELKSILGIFHRFFVNQNQMGVGMASLTHAATSRVENSALLTEVCPWLRLPHCRNRTPCRTPQIQF